MSLLETLQNATGTAPAAAPVPTPATAQAPEPAQAPAQATAPAQAPAPAPAAQATPEPAQATPDIEAVLASLPPGMDKDAVRKQMEAHAAAQTQPATEPEPVPSADTATSKRRSAGRPKKITKADKTKLIIGLATGGIPVDQWSDALAKFEELILG